MSTVPAGRIGCLKCPAQWGGMNTAHCAACHHTFSGVTSFDRHRIAATDGPNSKRPFGACHDPATMTKEVEDGEPVLVFADADRAYPCWTLAGSKKEPEDG